MISNLTAGEEVSMHPSISPESPSIGSASPPISLRGQRRTINHPKSLQCDRGDNITPPSISHESPPIGSATSESHYGARDGTRGVVSENNRTRSPRTPPPTWSLRPADAHSTPPHVWSQWRIETPPYNLSHSQAHVAAVCAAGVVPTLLTMLEGEEYEVKKEVAYAVCNACCSGSAEVSASFSLHTTILYCNSTVLYSEGEDNEVKEEVAYAVCNACCSGSVEVRARLSLHYTTLYSEGDDYEVKKDVAYTVCNAFCSSLVEVRARHQPSVSNTSPPALAN